ncbi:MAG: hypothetical protein JWP89_801 [Schlesneria sp.]|nr:hypothetical protein [Schlesneria sp.]
MWQSHWNVIHEESIGFLIGASFALVAASVATWRRRRREFREINQGHQFQQLEFAYAFVTTDRKGQRRFVVRMIGCLPLKVFVAKDAIRSHLLGLSRESAEDELNSVIAMEGKLGSFVLRELHGHLRTLLEEKGLKREWWLMAPILETYRPLQYVAPTVLLVRKSDLPIFASFDSCQDLLVHHGSDAAKILTLMEVYRKFKDQEQRLAQARAEGRSTQYLEEMWLLDLSLSTDMLEPTDEEVSAGTLKPFRTPPWTRFASTLNELGLSMPTSIEVPIVEERPQLVASGT